MRVPSPAARITMVTGFSITTIMRPGVQAGGKPWDRQPVSGKLRRELGVSPGFAAVPQAGDDTPLAFGPWSWTMVQIEYAGDRDFQVQGNVSGRPGGRATDRRVRTGHAIRTAGSRRGAD